MLFDPTERNVDPFLFPTRIRTMKKLVLTSAIHDKNVTMAETAQDRRLHLKTAEPPRLTETMSLASPDSPNRGSSSRFAAVGTSPSAHQGFIRGVMALHTPSSNGQHRRPVCGPISGPCPYEYEQVHKESQGTAHAVWYDPFLTQSPVTSREEKRFFP